MSAVAEFARSSSEAITRPDEFTVVTALGGVRITPDPCMAVRAYEALGACNSMWQTRHDVLHAVAP